MNHLLLAVLASLIILGQPAIAQTDDSQRIQTLEHELQAQRELLNDWASLTRYGSENSELPPAAPGEERVVFLGDEITEQWGKGRTPFFPGKPYLNRGIGGQTTPQMLVRFRQDVISLKPKVVVILAGTNDIASVTGPGTQGMMIENFMSMVDLAKVNGIDVVLASILPVCDCFTNHTHLRPIGKIRGMNAALRQYAAQSGCVYLDYYSALADGRVFKNELTTDGLLPNDAGYGIMAPLAERAIREALAKNTTQALRTTGAIRNERSKANLAKIWRDSLNGKEVRQ